MRTEPLRRQLDVIDSVETPDLRSQIDTRIRQGGSEMRVPERDPLMRAGGAALVVGVIVGIVAALMLVQILPNSRIGPVPAGGSDLRSSIVVGVPTAAGTTQLLTVTPRGTGADPVQAPGATFAGWEGNVSPDGSRVVFVDGAADDQTSGVFVGDLDEADAEPIADSPPEGAETPVWAPDGSKIVFSQNRVGHGELFTVEPDGSRLQQVTANDQGQDLDPAWSPDSSKIAFVRNSGGPIDLWVVAAEGGQPSQLTRFDLQAGGFPTSPAWSPAGDRIAFTADPLADGGSSNVPRDVWVMNPDGSNAAPLLETPNDERSPAWSPDGSKLVFFQSIGADPAELDLRGGYRVVLYDLVTERTTVLYPLPEYPIWQFSLQWVGTGSATDAATPTPGPALTDSPSPAAPHEGEVLIEPTSKRQQAEIFAFRAVAATGLMDPFGARSYNFTYADDTTRTENGWRVGFAASDCEPQRTGDGFGFTCRGLSGEDPDLGNALTDTYVIVRLDDGLWKVVDVEGNMLSDERERLVGVSLPQRSEPSHWEFPAIGHWLDEGTTVTEMVALWVGPYPTAAHGTVCTAQPIDANGVSVGKALRFYQPAPLQPFERGGWIRGYELPQGSVGLAEVTCSQNTGA
jgi:hypothetical protein